MDKASRQHPLPAAGPTNAPAKGDGGSHPRPSRTQVDRDLVKRLLAAAKSGADVRDPKVRRLRAAIRDGAYENDLKLEVALQRLQERMREEGALLSELGNPSGSHHSGGG